MAAGWAPRGPGLRQRSASAPKDEGDNEKYNADYEKYLREIRRKAGDTTEAQKRRYERDNSEDDGPFEHISSLFYTRFRIADQPT